VHSATWAPQGSFRGKSRKLSYKLTFKLLQAIFTERFTVMVSKLERSIKEMGRLHGQGAQNIAGKLYSKTEVIIILKML
jgi:hypothetical protein